MSLFPAYAGDDSTQVDNTQTETNNGKHFSPSKISVINTNTVFLELLASWLTNPSFQQPLNVDAPTIPEPSISSEKSNVSLEENVKKRKHKKEKSKKRHKKEKRKDKREEKADPEPQDFTGNEEYYLDKEPARGYANIQTLYKPACPRYRIRLSHLGAIPRNRMLLFSTKRYYEKNRVHRQTDDKTTLSDEEFTMRTKAIKEKLSDNPRDIFRWLEYVDHQKTFPMIATKTQLCERKIDVLKQALQANPGNELLYGEYVRIIDETYPSYEVSKILDGLISKGWKHFIHLLYRNPF